MEERNKKHYVVPEMKVYEIEPTQILAGSSGDTDVSVSSWGEGNSLGSYDLEED